VIYLYMEKLADGIKRLFNARTARQTVTRPMRLATGEREDYS
jgi:HAE1 family hydrophobic/amphiphilic exporter-1